MYLTLFLTIGVPIAIVIYVVRSDRFTEPTELVDGTVEFLGTEGEKFYALLVKLAERENMTVDDYFWDMIKRGVESSKTDPNFNSRLKLDKKITMDEIMENLEE